MKNDKEVIRKLLEVVKSAENWFTEAHGGPDTGIDSILIALREAITLAEEK